MDSFVTSLHHSSHSPTHRLALQFCTPRIQLVSVPDVHYKLEKSSDVSMHSQLTPNVWILTTAPSAVTTTITLICPGETTELIKVKKPIHVLQLPTACSATSPNFHLPPHNETTSLEITISLDMANLHLINISSLDFCIWQHLEKHWNESQLQHLASIPSV